MVMRDAENLLKSLEAAEEVFQWLAVLQEIARVGENQMDNAFNSKK